MTDDNNFLEYKCLSLLSLNFLFASSSEENKFRIFRNDKKKKKISHLNCSYRLTTENEQKHHLSWLSFPLPPTAALWQHRLTTPQQHQTISSAKKKNIWLDWHETACESVISAYVSKCSSFSYFWDGWMVGWSDVGMTCLRWRVSFHYDMLMLEYLLSSIFEFVIVFLFYLILLIL